MIEPPALDPGLERHFIPLSTDFALDVLVTRDEILVLLVVSGEAWVHLEIAGEC